MLVPRPDFIVEGPQRLEGGAPMDPAGVVENHQLGEPPSMKFTWKIENFPRLNYGRHYSEVFVLGGYKWRILIYPRGNNVDHLSMYLDAADSATLPHGWSRYTQFSLAVVNQINNKYTIRRDTQRQFNVRESDWGFTSFMPFGQLYDPGRGYMVADTVFVEAEVAVCDVLDYWSSDSKKETGYVGLKNQGATGYMNSLLQTFYHIPYFRKAIYHMPTTENDMPSRSIPLALQSLFYKLQYHDSSVTTKELTRSFGWDTSDSYLEHDVQELNRVLCEKLEDKMKGTVVEGTIQRLYEGHHMNYIECIDLDCKSTRKESFYDLQLDVKGCQDVYASFDKYVEVERLEGDNKYQSEEHGLQDAKKGVLFVDFPPVLQLHLKRFEYDFIQDTMVKINDRYEFPLQLDLDRDSGKYLSPDADRSVRNLYSLHSVLVHSGGDHGRHYYAFIRPTLSDQWFKFDDERVTKEDTKWTLEEQYGGEEELLQTNPGFNNTRFKFSSAYMLVYIRESDKDKLICHVDEKDMAEHLRMRLKKEEEEMEEKRRCKAQAKLYTIIKVARDEDLVDQIGKDMYFDLVDHDKVRSFRMKKKMPFTQFREEVAREFGVPVQCQRFWLWAKRQNRTYRPNRPLTSQEEAQSVGQIREISNKAYNAELKLFLEVELGLDQVPVSPPEKSDEDILLFFKLYNPEKGELRYVGRLFVKSYGRPIEILPRLNEMAGFNQDEELELFEEINFEPNVMCEHVDKEMSFLWSQFGDGDIICFQKARIDNEDEFHYPHVPSFLEYVHNRQHAMEEQGFTLRKHTWKITNFTTLTQRKYYSEVFTLSNNAWRMLIFPKGNNTEHLSIYLDVADSERLSSGWSRNARFKLILVDQKNYGNSRIRETEHNFTARECFWGFTSFILLSEVHDSRNGYLVNDTLMVVAEISAPQLPAENTWLAESSANIPHARLTDTFNPYFSNLEEIINVAESSLARGRSNASNQKGALSTYEAPTLQEVEKAKLSLKECLSDIFKLNVKDKLAEAVSTLSIAKSGLSQYQQNSVKAFWANFDEFTTDFMTFERDNVEFELQKLLKDQRLVTMKKNHETHIMYKQVMGALTEEEEELNQKLEELKSKREMLISDWEILMVESEEAKSGYKDLQKKVAEAEEKKRIAEERMSRSTTAWSNLKMLFS